MIAYKENEKQHLVEFTVSGHFTNDDFVQVRNKIVPIAQKWDDIKILEIIKDLEDLDANAVLKDIKYGFQSMEMIKKFKKCAVVTDKKWIKQLSNTMHPLFDAEIKGFELHQLEEAKTWLLQ
jgi:hypothetical protein